MKLTCQQCNGTMRKTTLSSGNCLGIMVALLVFIMGVALALLVPILGWVAGPIICLIALGMGGKRQRVWKCNRCGHYLNRA